MKHLVGVAVLLLAVMVGLGFYRGWFQLSTKDTGDKPSATITMDKGKIQADEKKAKEEMHDFGQKAKETTGDRTAQAK
jgi:predicted negative regulator of RcsB-dependent stress response